MNGKSKFHPLTLEFVKMSNTDVIKNTNKYN